MMLAIEGIFLIVWLLGIPMACGPGEMVGTKQSNILGRADQLILVITRDWNAVDGKLMRYEKGPAGQWRRVGEHIPIVVGRNGMAWGRGLHGDSSRLAKPEDPIKREGDGRSPAGIFALSRAFGYAPSDQAGTLKLPYVQADSALECVDDPQSAYYNRLVGRSKVAHPDWKSSEEMRRRDDQYRWGVVVDHNSDPPQPGCGSCIFLHIWKAAGDGTAGCTAMNAAKMEEVMRWLDAQKNPLIVQLPQAEYERLRDDWGLPR